MNNYSQIGKRVHSCRKGKGYSLESFRTRLIDERRFDIGGTVGTLSRIEAGELLPSVELLIAMDGTGFATPDWILFGEERLPVFHLKEIVRHMDSPAFYDFEEVCDSLVPEEDNFFDNLVEIQVSMRFREIRKHLGLTLGKAASRLAMNLNTVSQHERSDKFPEAKYLLAFCREFGASASYILGTYNSLPERLLEIQELLGACSFEMQGDFVRKFSEIAENF